jgi:hypothetical protein
MLRITVFSLLLGALALIAALVLLFPPARTTSQQVPPVNMVTATTSVVVGAGNVSGTELQLELSAAGIGTVSFTDIAIEASSYPFLHLNIEGPSADTQVTFAWNRRDTGQKGYFSPAENHARKSLWLAMHEMADWTGVITSLSVIIVGQPGEVVRVTDFSLLGASHLRQLRALYSDLTRYTPWSRSAMNTHTGATTVSSFYPVPLFVAYLLLSLVSYVILLIVFRATLTFNWRVVALIFLACWISLDLSWQRRLLHQLADTYHTFSGKSTQQKLAVGPDAKLYNFIAQVKPLLEPDDARIFVSSSDNYLGQRGAYYLFPFNVYWSETWRAFPHSGFMHKGDYIVLINPSTLRFDREHSRLLIKGSDTIAATLVLADPAGTVVRVN